MTKERKILGGIVTFLLIATTFLAGCASTPLSTSSTLQFSSSPPGAQVYLDNQFQGTTPTNASGVNPGVHLIEYRLSGYQNWMMSATVPAGSSTYFAALVPTSQQSQPVITQETSSYPAAGIVTVQVDKSQMVVGNSQMFSGTGTPGENVQLVLYGPGKYKDGVNLIQASVNSLGSWSYLWNPGSSVLAGSYTIIATNIQRSQSDRDQFVVIGGGIVSVAPNRATYSLGDSVGLSGRCTTGSNTVIVTLFGPGQYANGAVIGMQSVTADQTWSMKFATTRTMALGLYSVKVQDLQQTASSTASFSLINS